MARKEWLLLLVPLGLMVFALISILGVKDPEQLMINSQEKVSALDSYIIESTLIMDMGFGQGVVRYSSNITNVLFENNSYSRVVTQAPFTNGSFIEERFRTDEGNFSCSNSLSKPFCVREDEEGLGVQEFSKSDYESLDYLGTKKVKGRSCDVLYGKVNKSSVAGMAGALTDADLSGINEVFVYSCIDPLTGFSLESFWGLAGQTNYGTFIVDIGVNVTKEINNLTTDIENFSFKLPYEIITMQEYESLINESLNEFNYSLSSL